MRVRMRQLRSGEWLRDVHDITTCVDDLYAIATTSMHLRTPVRHACAREYGNRVLLYARSVANPSHLMTIDASAIMPPHIGVFTATESILYTPYSAYEHDWYMRHGDTIWCVGSYNIVMRTRTRARTRHRRDRNVRHVIIWTHQCRTMMRWRYRADTCVMYDHMLWLNPSNPRTHNAVWFRQK